MTHEYHVLNGDALKDRFPIDLLGDHIVARECLIEGTLQGETLEEFFRSRSALLAQLYPQHPVTDYYQRVVPQFEKLKNIPQNAEVNLWFEDDLFCQANFWFVAYILFQYSTVKSIFLVRPVVHTQYGFGGLSDAELINLYENRIAITDLAPFASLWTFYKNGDAKNLLKVSSALAKEYQFVLPAVEAHLARIPQEGRISRPTQTLLSIIDELQTTDFSPVFKEFSKREAIYGFGDLQVKNLLDELLNV